MIPGLAFTVGSIATNCSSEAGAFVLEQETGVRKRLQESYALGMEGKGVLEEVFRTAEDFAAPNWDGYGATPVSEDVCWVACQFLQSLPLGTPAPAVGAEPDGDLTLEWYRNPNRVLSVSISADGRIHYSAIVGSSKAYGTEIFWGEVPRSVTEQIRRVHAV